MKIFLVILFSLLILPGFAQEDDEAFVEELQDLKEQQAKQINNLLPGQKKDEASQHASLPEEIEKLGYKEIDMKALSDERVVKALQGHLKNNPLRNIGDNELKKLIKDKSAGTSLEFIFDTFPKVLECTVALLKDEKALSSALGIFLRKGDMKIYVAVWFLFIVMSWLIKKILFNDDTNRTVKTLGKMTVSLLITAGCLYSFYQIFEKELGPAVSIILKYF